MRLSTLIWFVSAAVTTAFEPRLMTLDPGHFHAALVQKTMVPGVNAEVDIYAPAGPDLDLHLKRIEGFNTRAEAPTRWVTRVHRAPDFLDKMIAERPGNVVVISGNNARKADYILRSVEAGFHVLSDKPMAIRPEDYGVLKRAFEVAEARGVRLYDIMTERYEISTILQRELSGVPQVFGERLEGTADDPAITKESVHHFAKEVAGKPLVRPPWFFDVAQQGEGIVDVTTHLVDLVQWELFPEVALDAEKDVEVLAGRRWATALTRDEFAKVTGQAEFPEYLRKDVDAGGKLQVYCNGEIRYRLRGVHARVSVIWNFEAPPGAKDTHASVMRGSKARLVIRQGAEQGYRPELYVEPVGSGEGMEAALRAAVEGLAARWPGLGVEPAGAGAWRVVIPDRYHVGHEAHFAQVADKFFGFLREGGMPKWEVPSMLAKYRTTTRAWELARAAR
jgi:predicted dehydrogenase